LFDQTVAYLKFKPKKQDCSSFAREEESAVPVRIKPFPSQVVSKVRVLRKEISMCESPTEKTSPKKEISGTWVLLMFIALLAIVVILNKVIS